MEKLTVTDISLLLIYLRKSRSDGEYNTIEQVLAKHEQQLQDYATKEFGCTIPIRNIYREVVSGETIDDRPVMKEMLKRIESGLVKGVLVVDPQRLSRGDLSDCGYIVNTFRYSNTYIITPMMTYNLSNKMERKFFEQELMRGNDYLEYTKEILYRGRIASIKKGNYIGSTPPYGYRKIKYEENGQKYFSLEIVPEEADAIRLMYDLYVNKNMGYQRIADSLDNLGIKPKISLRWSSAAIKDMLENPVYIGKLRWNWRKTTKVISDGQIVRTRPKSPKSDWLLVDGRHEAIISEDMYYGALAKKGANVRVKSKAKIRNPFAGLVYCICGKPMSYRTYKNDRGLIRCDARLVCDNQIHCHNKSCTYTDFENRIIDVLIQNIKDFEIKLNNEIPNDNSQKNNVIAHLEKELIKIDKMDDEQHDLLECKIYSREVFLKRNAKLQERKREVQEALNNAQIIQFQQIDYKKKIYTFTETVESLQSPDVDIALKNNLLKKCITKITYSRPATINKYDTTPFSIEVQLRL